MGVFLMNPMVISLNPVVISLNPNGDFLESHVLTFCFSEPFSLIAPSYEIPPGRPEMLP